MKLVKMLSYVSIVTMLALVYVHQQVELVKISYAIECKDKRVRDMLDRREGLEYNIDNLTATSRLERVLISRKIDVTLPKRGNVVKMAKSLSRVRREEVLRTSAIERRAGILEIFDLIIPKAEAQAKER